MHQQFIKQTSAVVYNSKGDKKRPTPMADDILSETSIPKVAQLDRSIQKA
jgi:hypothetical protein